MGLHGGQGDAAEALWTPPRPEITAPVLRRPAGSREIVGRPFFLPARPPARWSSAKGNPWVRSTAFPPSLPSTSSPPPFVSTPARVLHQLSPDGAGKARE